MLSSGKGEKKKLLHTKEFDRAVGAFLLELLHRFDFGTCGNSVHVGLDAETLDFLCGRWSCILPVHQ